MRFFPLDSIEGSPRLPGDKSISHRCLILAALVKGESVFTNMSTAEDVLSTQKLLMQLGVEVIVSEKSTSVRSTGRFRPPQHNLDCGNAGTLMRLMMGVLCGQSFSSQLVGDESLSLRPMGRVLDPLLKMCAAITLTDKNFAPVQIAPAQIHATSFELAVASAQVKSAILFAALQAEGVTTLSGKVHSRDHTERLLRFFGVQVAQSEDKITIEGRQQLTPQSYNIPNDVSAASFWIAATLLSRSGSTCLRHVGVNPTRTGFIEVLKEAGADIEIQLIEENPEPVADILTRSSRLNGFRITKDRIPSLVDEVPLLALVATQCSGPTVIEGVAELRFKETDRVFATVNAIRSLGGEVFVDGDDLHIKGNQTLSGGTVESYGDHRIAMMAAIARFCSNGPIEISNFACVKISDPHFESEMVQL